MSSSSSVSLASASASTATTSLGGGSFSRTSSGHDAIALRQAAHPKCKEKDALCRAMGTLFLQHRVDKLQCDVDRLEKRESPARGGGACPWKASWKGGCSKRKEGRAGDLQAFGRIATDVNSSKEEINTSATHPEGQARKIIVVDVSLLIYSLRTIHNWLKEGDCRVVVPIESLRTLDLLKKGDHYLNLAARKATRFLDERFASPGFMDHGVKLVPGLVPQMDTERIVCSGWSEVGKMLSHAQHDFFPSDEMDLRQQPHAIRETMACTMYFIRQYTLSPSTIGLPIVSLGLALPPPHFDGSDDIGGDNIQCLKYAQRADGNALLRLARHLGLGDKSSAIGDRLIVAPTATSWLTADANNKDPRKSFRDTNG